MQRVITKQKAYVSVLAVHNIDGTSQPFIVGYRDGTKYRIADIVKSDDIIIDAYKGLFITRHTVRVGEGFYELFDEHNGRWYIMEKVYVEVPDEEFYQYGT